MGAQLILGAQQILMVLGAQGAQGAQTMNCTKAMCCFRLPAVVNEKAHMGHLCDFSPPFFVWVLDVKGIILSSVEYQLAFFFVNWYF